MATTLPGRAAAGKTSRGGPDPATPPTKARRKWLSWKRSTPYLLLVPAAVLELLIHVIPMVVGLWMSFIELTQYYITNWSEAPWKGLGNFTVALDFSGPLGRQLLRSFGVTLGFTVLTVGISFGLGLCAALALQRFGRGRGFIRTLFLTPYALPAYAGIITWKFMLQRDNGLVNQLITNDLHLTGNRPFWLIGSNAFVSVVVVAIWQQWPFAFLMTMAGMQVIPDEVYQASSIDGASTWQQIRHVTLGMMKPINSVLLLLLFLWTFREFNTPFVLFGPTPPASADLLTIHIYSSSFINWNFGLGSAMSALLMLFLILVAGGWALWNRRISRDA
ncbi:carbohydrate ABC transporter permease [Mangrovihabitans endophyticus]|uniref:ABC transporter permease n=1 Tax=Mangrovihabitans endophyticus TaxID=1751298 RepID=A0A8J3FN66_9ACTN|nr:sugar ABC transporter permease [Mangrovihabitans endophyticus]GGK81558.1 ABC transporter permease [Mangrovihabitans endophyticus]